MTYNPIFVVLPIIAVLLGVIPTTVFAERQFTAATNMS